MTPIHTVATPVVHLVGPGKLRVLNGRLAYLSPGNDPLRLDPAALGSLFCYGDVGLTNEALGMLLGMRSRWHC